MNEKNEIPRDNLDLQDNPEILSPPLVQAPLYACATAVTVLSFIAHAELELEIDGTTLPIVTAHLPEPDGYTFTGLAPLQTGWMVRARQIVDGITSDWSTEVIVRDHTADYPAGPPRPVINPAPVYQCGSRTGVSNLLIGSNVWIEANGSERGRVRGAKDHQGVNVRPDYDLNERVRAYTELCEDFAPPSEEHISQPPPSPLPVPGIDDTYEGAEQIRINNLVNGARFTLIREGSTVGTYRTWGYAHLVGLNPPLAAGETLEVAQHMCESDPESDPGSTTVRVCSQLPAPVVDPVQVGATEIRIRDKVPSARIKIFADLEKIGDGSGMVIPLVRPVEEGETLYVLQVLGECTGQTVRVVVPLCVAPPIYGNPAWRNLFPVGHWDYDEGEVKGSVYYPAEDDGKEQPFYQRLAELGPIPIIFMAHGNHHTRFNPLDRYDEGSPNCGSAPPDWHEIPNHKGYNYFQRQLARLGIIAVSVDCNVTNGCTSNSISNIEDRAELIMASMEFFMKLHTSGHDLFGDRIDFENVGLLGHSRGGEAVIIAANQAPSSVGDMVIKAVISLAPVNHDVFEPQDYAFTTILPANDGDVASNPGAKFYDIAIPSPFKLQLYIDYANHNYFNREWVRDEGSRTSNLLSRGEQERILSAYGCAFYRAFLLQHNTTPYLTYRAFPSTVNTNNVHLSFEWADQVMVDDHEQDNGIDRNTLDEPTTQLSVSADEYTLWQGGSSPYQPNTFYGRSVGMVLECEEINGTFRSQLDREYDLSQPEYEIWVRAAEVSEGGFNPIDATGFAIGLEDAEGQFAWTNSDKVGGLPRPFDRAWTKTKTIFTTLRFPVSCFIPEEPEAFNPAIIRAILLRCDRSDQRAVAFDVLQIVSR